MDAQQKNLFETYCCSVVVAVLLGWIFFDYTCAVEEGESSISSSSSSSCSSSWPFTAAAALAFLFFGSLAAFASASARAASLLSSLSLLRREIPVAVQRFGTSVKGAPG